MFRDISVRFSRKVIIASFILSVFVMYIHAKNLDIMILVMHMVRLSLC